MVLSFGLFSLQRRTYNLFIIFLNSFKNFWKVDLRNEMCYDGNQV
ncbi:hypothetical protein SAMN06265219_104220 [Gracilimonas mengyeensis]|uniref:Uncharacterized protein n=1 Tax=Gracilimonas mengyeensis TaxID=1302730 RepID=A0A521C6U9_9BACT|nr:hypothetical protein SAMN06265219_104220 [Gracilimonas mengyeensis]